MAMNPPRVNSRKPGYGHAKGAPGFGRAPVVVAKIKSAGDLRRNAGDVCALEAGGV